jgi:hypothetical protein
MLAINRFLNYTDECAWDAILPDIILYKQASLNLDVYRG